MECPRCDGSGYVCNQCGLPADIMELDSNNGMCAVCVNDNEEKETVKND